MREIFVELIALDRDPVETYEVIADFARYPDHSPAVRQVEVTEATERTTVSRWEVNFRTGILRWVEEDLYRPEVGRIEFRQLEGDVALFEGAWECRDDPLGTRVVFEARLDMGMPTLADALEPIAVRTLVENTVAIVSGLFDGAVGVASGTPATGATSGRATAA
jgi:ribosome-associated toxin RatA of RatAB toxin-antitoxin module